MKKETLKIASKSTFEVSVREEPKENRANDRVMTLVARHFGVPVKRVRIVSGHHSPSKTIQIAE